MNIAEIKSISDGIFGGATKVEATLTPREYYVNTMCWMVTADQLQRMAAHFAVIAIAVEGYKIQLTINLK